MFKISSLISHFSHNNSYILIGLLFHFTLILSRYLNSNISLTSS